MVARAARPVLGPGPDRLLVDGRDVAPVLVADTPSSRRTGLLGSSGVDGALWITRCPTVHMVGMRYAIDVAVLDRHGEVLHTGTLRPGWGMTRPRLRAAATVETMPGSLAAWGVRPGSVLEVVAEGGSTAEGPGGSVR